jgi:hypothetical protein
VASGAAARPSTFEVRELVRRAVASGAMPTVSGLRSRRRVPIKRAHSFVFVPSVDLSCFPKIAGSSLLLLPLNPSVGLFLRPEAVSAIRSFVRVSDFDGIRSDRLVDDQILNLGHDGQYTSFVSSSLAATGALMNSQPPRPGG